MTSEYSINDSNNLRRNIQQWALELGFDQVGFSDIDLSGAEERLKQWLAQDYHGDMEWMARHGDKRSRPAELEPGTLSVIAVRMNYLPPQQVDPVLVLNHPECAYISRYALGRDYHKVMRNRLQSLATRIAGEVGSYSWRVFVDSAPVLEKPIAVKCGLGWQGKHTNILNRDSGSWFFLGEIYTDLPLAESVGQEADHCGSCTACIDVCPTRAIIAPYVLDARLCISYLTIEHQGSIPEHLRPLLGNRIYGCDDCQLVCPWNRFARTTQVADFAARNGLETAGLLTLFAWDEEAFLRNLEGSPIRRIGYQRWQRNIAIALGNAPASWRVLCALEDKLHNSSDMVGEHIRWSMERHRISFG